MRFSLQSLLILLLLFGAAKEAAGQFDTEILDDIRVFDRFGQVSESDFETENEYGYPYEYLKKETLVRVQERDRGIVATMDHLIRIKVHYRRSSREGRSFDGGYTFLLRR
jgi:hypothetical protein